MRISKTSHIEITEEVGKKCDRCGIVHFKENADFEYQEMISIKFQGGYGSIFGDGNTIELDLCQRCFAETLGAHLRISDN